MHLVADCCHQIEIRVVLAIHIFRCYIIIVSCMTYLYYLYMKSVGDKNGTEDVQMGRLGSEFSDHIDRNMWAEDKDNLEV